MSHDPRRDTAAKPKKTPRQKAYAKTIERLEALIPQVKEAFQGGLPDGVHMNATDEIRDAYLKLNRALDTYRENPIE